MIFIVSGLNSDMGSRLSRSVSGGGGGRHVSTTDSDSSTVVGDEGKNNEQIIKTYISPKELLLIQKLCPQNEGQKT